MAGDGDPYFHPRRHVFAQHLLDPAQRPGSPTGLFDQFDDDDLPGLSIAATVGRHDDVLIDALVVGNDEAGAALLAKPTHHGLGIALQHLDHRAFAPAPIIHPDHPHHRPITVQQLAHLPRGEKQAVAAFVGDQESVAFGMTDHPPGHQVHLADRPVAFAAIADQLPVPLHGPQATGQSFDFPAFLHAPFGA